MGEARKESHGSAGGEGGGGIEHGGRPVRGKCWVFGVGAVVGGGAGGHGPDLVGVAAVCAAASQREREGAAGREVLDIPDTTSHNPTRS